jgi:EAL domain-containing protein (putative c-di-GMP-specific phosphodiesterase class I)
MTQHDRDKVEDALDGDRLLLHYQPIHDIRDGSVVAVEALLRERQKDGDVESAPEIAKAAEKGPQVVTLDDWMVPEAFGAAAAWQDDGFPGVRIHVNLSPREFEEEQETLVARLDQSASESGIDPRRVTLEITETRYFDDPDATVTTLKALRERGYQLWLDDFGEGHSTLALLRHFPLDGLKVPGAFVQTIESDHRCRAIAESIAALARSLDLRVVAEEVENERQLAILRDAGCDYVQGFLLSRAMGAGKLLEFLRSSR